MSRRIDAADRATRLAPADPAAHLSLALVLRNQGDMEEARTEFQRAAALRPRDYVLWYELALAHSATGDREAAIQACEQAVRLAPFYGRTHWLLGNLFYRAGRRDEAFAELRRAAASDAESLPSLIDLAWGTFGGDARAVEEAVQPRTDAARVALANYFARKGKLDEAIALFRSAGKASEDDRRAFLKALLAARRFKEAYAMWANIQPESVRENDAGVASIRDGSFEGVIKLNETGFNWQQPAGLENVHVSVDTASPRAGVRSLRVEFRGNSAPSSAVISQLVLVEPSARYNLRFAARTEQIVTGGLPQIAVAEAGGAEVGPLLGVTVLPTATEGWHDYSMELKTGKETQAILIILNRQSCNSSTCPAYGRVWLDDFSLESLSN